MARVREAVKLVRDLVVILFGIAILFEYAGVHLFG